MSFADPATVTISAVPITLPRVSTGEDKSEYMSGDGLNHLTASHDYGDKRTRRMIRWDGAKMAPDAFRPAENVQVTTSVYVVFDVPAKGGYTATESLAIWTGFNAYLTASSSAIISKLLGGES